MDISGVENSITTIDERLISPELKTWLVETLSSQKPDLADGPNRLIVAAQKRCDTLNRVLRKLGKQEIPADLAEIGKSIFARDRAEHAREIFEVTQLISSVNVSEILRYEGEETQHDEFILLRSSIHEEFANLILPSIKTKSAKYLEVLKILQQNNEDKNIQKKIDDAIIIFQTLSETNITDKNYSLPIVYELMKLYFTYYELFIDPEHNDELSRAEDEDDEHYIESIITNPAEGTIRDAGEQKVTMFKDLAKALAKVLFRKGKSNNFAEEQFTDAARSTSTVNNFLRDPRISKRIRTEYRQMFQTATAQSFQLKSRNTEDENYETRERKQILKNCQDTTERKYIGYYLGYALKKIAQPGKYVVTEVGFLKVVTGFSVIALKVRRKDQDGKPIGPLMEIHINSDQTYAVKEREKGIFDIRKSLDMSLNEVYPRVFINQPNSEIKKSVLINGVMRNLNLWKLRVKDAFLRKLQLLNLDHDQINSEALFISYYRAVIYFLSKTIANENPDYDSEIAESELNNIKSFEEKKTYLLNIVSEMFMQYAKELRKEYTKTLTISQKLFGAISVLQNKNDADEIWDYAKSINPELKITPEFVFEELTVEQSRKIEIKFYERPTIIVTRINSVGKIEILLEQKDPTKVSLYKKQNLKKTKIPGGGKNPGEDDFRCLLREINEEMDPQSAQILTQLLEKKYSTSAKPTVLEFLDEENKPRRMIIFSIHLNQNSSKVLKEVSPNAEQEDEDIENFEWLSLDQAYPTFRHNSYMMALLATLPEQIDYNTSSPDTTDHPLFYDARIQN